MRHAGRMSPRPSGAPFPAPPRIVALPVPPMRRLAAGSIRRPARYASRRRDVGIGRAEPGMGLADPAGQPRHFGTAASQVSVDLPPDCGVGAAPERLAHAPFGPAAGPLRPFVGDGRVPGCAAGLVLPAAGGHDTGGEQHAVPQAVVLVRMMVRRLGRCGAVPAAILAAAGRGAGCGRQQQGDQARDPSSCHCRRTPGFP